jgi:FkbM family methyltransferase
VRLGHLVARAKSLLSGRPETYSRKYDRIFWALGVGDVAIDCGANVGHYTAIMARGGATVYAFEPNPHAFAALAERFRDATNVHCLARAVYAEEARLPLYLHEHAKADPLRWSTGSSLLANKPNVDPRSFVLVETIDLAAFIETLGRPVALMKMDIEGAEAVVLARLIETGAISKIRNLLVETHDGRVPGLAPEMERVRRLIRERGLENVDLGWT